MNHALADLPVSAANSQIFHGTAETAARVSLKMSQNNHRIVIEHMLSYRHLCKVLSSANWNHDCSVFIHNIDRAKIPLIFSVSRCFSVVSLSPTYSVFVSTIVLSGTWR